MKNNTTKVAAFIISQMLSVLGSEIVGFSIIWYITLSTGSSLKLAVSIITSYLPQVLVSIFIGGLSDRVRKKDMIIIGDAATTVSTLWLLVMMTLGYDSIAVIYATCALRSIGAGIQSPMLNAFLPEICAESMLIKVNGIISTMNSLIKIVAPALAAWLIRVLELRAALLVDFITATIAISILFVIPVAETINPIETTHWNGIVADIREGLRYFSNHTILGRLIAFYVAFYFFMAAPGYLTSVLINQKFFGNVEMLMINELVWSIGMVIGGVVAVYLKKDTLKMLALSCMLFGVNIFFLGAVRTFVPYLVFMLLAGISLPLFTTTNTTIIQKNVRQDLMGRTFSNLNLFTTAATMGGILFFGILGEHMPIDRVISVTGVVIVIVSLLCWRVVSSVSTIL